YRLQRLIFLGHELLPDSEAFLRRAKGLHDALLRSLADGKRATLQAPTFLTPDLTDQGPGTRRQEQSEYEKPHRYPSSWAARARATTWPFFPLPGAAPARPGRWRPPAPCAATMLPDTIVPPCTARETPRPAMAAARAGITQARIAKIRLVIPAMMAP